MKTIGIFLIALGLSLTASMAQTGTYSSLTVTGTAAINYLNVTGSSGANFANGKVAIGPGAASEQNSFGAELWVSGPDSYSDVTGKNMAVIASHDSEPKGFAFKLLTDDNGNTVPALLSNWLGVGALPLDLNVDDNGAEDPAPVLVGGYTWDGTSMFQVTGYTSLNGNVEILQPQGDISMGGFTTMP